MDPESVQALPGRGWGGQGGACAIVCDLVTSTDLDGQKGRSRPQMGTDDRICVKTNELCRRTVSRVPSDI